MCNYVASWRLFIVQIIIAKPQRSGETAPNFKGNEMGKKHYLRFMALLTLVILLLLWSLQVQAETVTGTVVGRAGELKSMAGITLEGQNRYMSMTNTTGQFTIENVKPGRYTLTVTQGNYVQKFNVSIDGNNTLDLRVRW
jgi:Carboxypeptidase regulatory-like domain